MQKIFDIFQLLLGYQCGYRFPPIAGARTPIPGSGQSNYMSYPWQGIIIDFRIEMQVDTFGRCPPTFQRHVWQRLTTCRGYLTYK
jgi:hypothetical protein